MAALATPTRSGRRSRVSVAASMPARARAAAPTLIGTVMSTENRATAARSTPRARPAVMVAPDRETPGARATAWANAMPTTGPVPRSARPVRCGPKRSTSARATPNTASSTATRQGSVEPARSRSGRSPPTATAGSSEATSSQPRRAARSSRGRRRAPANPATSRSTALPSRRTSARTWMPAPSAVPTCRAASKAVRAAGSSLSQPSNHGTSTRCPEEDTGANSVSPCTAPSRAARVVGPGLTPPRRPAPAPRPRSGWR